MSKEGNVRKFKPSIVLNVVLILILLGSASWFFLKYRQERSDLGKKLAETSSELASYKSDPTQASKAEALRIVNEVARLYDLPKDEEPSVATVSDKEKLKDQPFFAKAENGDITLIYSKAKLAILYRPSSKQIINVSSVTIQDPETQPATPAEPAQ